eukprot:117708-Amphidinium_carterae.1
MKLHKPPTETTKDSHLNFSKYNRLNWFGHDLKSPDKLCVAAHFEFVKRYFVTTGARTASCERLDYIESAGAWMSSFGAIVISWDASMAAEIPFFPLLVSSAKELATPGVTEDWLQHEQDIVHKEDSSYGTHRFGTFFVPVMVDDATVFHSFTHCERISSMFHIIAQIMYVIPSEHVVSEMQLAP